MTWMHNRRMFVGGMIAAATTALAPFKASAQPRSAGRQIEIEAADGKKFDAYLSAPGAGKGPGIIMASTIFGLDQDMKDMSDDLARAGCVAVAPNFFWRDQDSGALPIPTGMQRAVARAERTDFAQSMDDLKRCIAEARRHPRSNGKIAVLGFCYGGLHAWRSACDGFGVDAALSFHGSFLSKYMKPGDKPSCPVALHYGDKDELAPPAELEAVKKMADATGSEFVIHPGAGHGYMLRSAHGHGNPHGHADAEAERKSWARAMQMIDALRT